MNGCLEWLCMGGGRLLQILKQSGTRTKGFARISTKLEAEASTRLLFVNFGFASPLYPGSRIRPKRPSAQVDSQSFVAFGLFALIQQPLNLSGKWSRHVDKHIAAA